VSDDPNDVDGATAKRVRAANDKGRMGPGEHAGGYGSQRADTDRHGGSYGANEGAGGGYEPGADRLRGQQHMSGSYGAQAYGRLDGGRAGIPRDPSQREARPATSADAAPAAQPPGDSPNAMLAASGSPAPIARGTETERDSPGISTDKWSDDTKA